MMVDGWNIIVAGRSLVAQANGGLSNHVTKPWEGPSSLYYYYSNKVQFSALDSLPKEGHRMGRKLHTSVHTCARPADKVRSCGLQIKACDMHFSDN